MKLGKAKEKEVGGSRAGHVSGTREVPSARVSSLYFTQTRESCCCNMFLELFNFNFSFCHIKERVAKFFVITL